MRGLKHQYHDNEEQKNYVAPYVGAWIETNHFAFVPNEHWVAPYVGAWIETCLFVGTACLLVESHPTWVRGLKLLLTCVRLLPLIVAPYVGAWIETKETETAQNNIASHPTWVRGLKLRNNHAIPSSELSHPTWVRGLKLIIIKLLLLLVLSHPTWVRGLKLCDYLTIV